MYRERVCMDMSNCDWLLRWSGWNVQTDRQFVWTCPIVTGYWDGAVGMYKHKSTVNGNKEKRNY